MWRLAGKPASVPKPSSVLQRGVSQSQLRLSIQRDVHSFVQQNRSVRPEESLSSRVVLHSQRKVRSAPRIVPARSKISINRLGFRSFHVRAPNDKGHISGAKTSGFSEFFGKGTDASASGGRTLFGMLFTFIRGRVDPLRRLTAEERLAFFFTFFMSLWTWALLATTAAVGGALYIAELVTSEQFVHRAIDAYLERIVPQVWYVRYGELGSVSGERALWKGRALQLRQVTVYRPPPMGSSAFGHSTVKLHIDRVELRLSVLWMLRGKGIVKELRFRGVRGHIDRRTEELAFALQDPSLRRHERAPMASAPANTKDVQTYERAARIATGGGFNFEACSGEDILITYRTPDPDLPPHKLGIFIFNCHKLRQEWLLFDLLRTSLLVGDFNDLLFKYGYPQEDMPALPDDKRDREKPLNNSERILASGLPAPLSHPAELKIASLPVDLLTHKATGPLAWLRDGTFDVVLDVSVVPLDQGELLPPAQKGAFFEQPTSQATVESASYGFNTTGDTAAPEHLLWAEEAKDKAVRFRIKTQLHHIFLSAPHWKAVEASWFQSAAVHPALRYMRTNRQHLALDFEVRLPLNNFHNAWTPTSAGLWDAISRAATDSIMYNISRETREASLKTIAAWGYRAVFPKRQLPYDSPPC